MKSTEYQLQVRRGAIAFVRRWLPDRGEPRAMLQIVHGMAEHGGRYERLARALTARGFAVYVQDLPGHGRTARAPDELGHFEEDGWTLALQSIRCLQHESAEVRAGLPQFILGHSMGSFLLQDYLSIHAQDLRGAVLSASTASLGPTRAPGLALLRAEALWKGRSGRSALADALTFRTYNRRFAPTRTGFDWLSSDAEEVARYVADPQCGFRCTTGLWIQLLTALGTLDLERARRVPKTLPLLAIAGEDDPVCAGRKGPVSLQKRYRRCGLKDVEVRTYPGARHEVFNERVRDQATSDLIAWLERHVG